MKYSLSEKFSKAKTLISKIQNILKIPKCLALKFSLKILSQRKVNSQTHPFICS